MNIDEGAGKQETNDIMMASSKTKLPEDESLSDRDFEGVISEGEETECADKIWEYYERHMDELEDRDEYAKNRGLAKPGDLEIDYLQNPNAAKAVAAPQPTRIFSDYGNRS